MATRIGVEVLSRCDAVKLSPPMLSRPTPLPPDPYRGAPGGAGRAEGELDAAFIPVESEHSAMSCCLGSAAVGARTYTATAGQGLELMHRGPVRRLGDAAAHSSWAWLTAPFPVRSTSGATTPMSWPRATWAGYKSSSRTGQEAVDQHICRFQDRGKISVCCCRSCGEHGRLSPTHMIEPILMPLRKKLIGSAAI